MKKYLVSMMLVVLACTSVKAQNTVVNNPDNRAYVGLRLGGVLTCPGKNSVENVSIDAFKNGGGFESGGIC